MYRKNYNNLINKRFINVVIWKHESVRLYRERKHMTLPNTELYPVYPTYPEPYKEVRGHTVPE